MNNTNDNSIQFLILSENLIDKKVTIDEMVFNLCEDLSNRNNQLIDYQRDNYLKWFLQDENLKKNDLDKSKSIVRLSMENYKNNKVDSLEIKDYYLHYNSVSLNLLWFCKVKYKFSYWLYGAAFEGSPELREIYEGKYSLPVCKIFNKKYEYISSEIANKILSRSWVFMLENDDEVHKIKRMEIKAFRTFLEKASEDKHICIVLRN